MKIIKIIIVILAILGLLILSVAFVLAAEIKLEDEQREINIAPTSEIKDNLILVGNQVNFEGKVDGDLIVLAGKLNFNGEVLGNLYSLAGQTQINGKVSHDVFLATGSADLGENAEISRNLYLYTATLTKSPQTKILGQEIIKKAEKDKKSRSKILLSWLSSTLGFILVGLVLWKLYPLEAEKSSEIIRQKPGRAVLSGIVAFIVLPILAVILFFTIVAIPLALILLGVYFFAIYISTLILAKFLSVTLWPKNQNQILGVVLFVIILTLLFKIPILGTILSLLTIWIGLGTLTQIRKPI